MKKTVILMLMIGFSFTNIYTANSQNIDSEHLEFSVYYNWGFIWINGGTLTLTASPDSIGGNAVTKLQGIGKSSSKWKWLFELEDYYTSWCNSDDLRPTKSIKNTMEGGYYIHNRYLFNYKDSLVYIRTEESRKPLTYDTIEINQKLFDAQSATAYLRFLNYDNYNPDDTISIAILMDGKLRKQQIVYKGKDVLKDKKNNYYASYRFTAVVEDNNLFSSSDAISVWISDDNKRIPLYIQAGLSIGSVKIFYRGIKLEED